MNIYLFLVLLANTAYAQLQNNIFAEKACELFQVWNQPSPLETFVRYNLDGEERSVSLSSQCIEGFENVLSRCQFLITCYSAQGWKTLTDRQRTGVYNSSLICSDFTIVASRSPKVTKRSQRANSSKRSQLIQGERSCSCASSRSSVPSDPVAEGRSSISTGPSTAATDAIMSSTSQDARAASSTTEAPAKSSLTSIPSLTESLTMTVSSAASLASTSKRICIIKLADLNSNPPGKCQCSDNNTIVFDAAACEPCS